MSIPKGFKPLLAEKAPDFDQVKFPLYASPKLDGIRCIMFGGKAYSRKLKLIPNAWVQSVLQHLPDGFDGELIVGAATGEGVLNRSTSGIMSRDGRPEFTYHVFDWYQTHDDGFPTVFDQRRARLHAWCRTSGTGLTWLKPVHQQAIRTVADLIRYEARQVAKGYEGTMIRSISGPYKFGRSTVKEGTLLKVKRWNDAEAEVINVVEQMKNENEATVDELGYTKRSTHKDNKRGKGTLGALVCKLITPADDPAHPEHHLTRPATVFELGTGFDDEFRQTWWNDKSPIGLIAKFKYQDLTPDGKPRFPVFLGWRDKRDM